MKHSRRKGRSSQAVRLSIDRLEDRRLLSAVSCTLSNGVIETAFCTNHDFIEVDLNAAAQTIAVAYNFQTFLFPAAEVQSVRIDGMEGNDLILLDTKLGLPTYLSATIDGNPLSGWVEVNPQPGSFVTHQHEGSGYVHWVINSWTYQNGWNFVPGNAGPADNQISQSAASLSGFSFASAGLSSDPLLSGHLFHLLSGGTSLTSGDLFGMIEHGFGLFPGASNSPHSGSGSAHDYLMNPPYQEVGHKPG
jgi:hypothetical protein